MGNALRGIVDVQAGGKTVRLHYTTNAICEFEDREKTGFSEFLVAFSGSAAGGGQSITGLRKLIWAGMIEHQPESTLRDAGALIDALGGASQAAKVLQAAITAAMPDAAADTGSAEGNVAAA